VHWIIEPDVSWMIMKYGFAGAGQSAGFGDVHCASARSGAIASPMGTTQSRLRSNEGRSVMGSPRRAQSRARDARVIEQKNTSRA
jgi:hypothetical protein